MKLFRLTIRKKTMLVIIGLASILIAASMIFYIYVINTSTSSHFKHIAQDLSETVAQLVDAERFVYVKKEVEKRVNNAENKVMSSEWGSDEWNDYTSLFADIEENDDFIYLRDYLRKIQDVNKVDCIYLTYVDTANELCVYVVDAAYEDACPPGCLDMLFDGNRDILINPTRGFPAYITNTPEYGWLVTAGAPIYYNGHVVGYAMSDISMEEIQLAQRESVIGLLLLQIAVLTIIAVAGILFVNYTLIKPLKTLTDAAAHYGTEGENGETRFVFSNLKIKTTDEIGDLAKSMQKMETEINRQIDELSLMNKRLSLSRSIASEMQELANTDALTGLNSKTAYDNKVKVLDYGLKNGGSSKFGIAMIDMNGLKEINDNYGHSAGDKAIIHISGIISSVFAHSPIFRIGGDEFVIVLQGRDFDNAEKLKNEFIKRIKSASEKSASNEEYHISAAIGCATFDSKKDRCVNDVFVRADEAMYDCKRDMKGQSEL